MAVVRKGMPDVKLTREQFTARFRQRFFDPAFDRIEEHIAALEAIAWAAYDDYRKNPRKARAGSDFAHPDAELPVEWLAARAAIRAAEARQRDPEAPARVLIVNGSPRSDRTCPGEMSKTWRLVELARAAIENECEVDVLDLSRLNSEYGRHIHPCKACVSTAQPLCHWPCSCYPNFAMGQVEDWMAEIYPQWIAAHGVMIVTPVHWYQAPSTLKLIMDRLVCADGGNPDPTTTDGKDPARAKDLELAGWDYPQHLAGRLFAVAVHGDTAGVGGLARALTAWLEDIGLVRAAPKAVAAGYVGYYRPYATSHHDLDEDAGFRTEVANAARSLVNAVRLQRQGNWPQADARIERPRKK